MSREFYIHYGCTQPWTKATEMYGAMTYDDVLLKQGSSTEIDSRSEPETTVKFGPYCLDTPIVTAPMDTVSGETMIRKMHELGAIGSLPRGDLQTRLDLCENLSTDGIPCLYAVGTKNGYEEARSIKERGGKIVLIDSAHGGMKTIELLAEEIKSRLDLFVVAGNITTYEQAEQYKKHGVDIARVGVGAGSACITRLKAGVGMPQLSAIFETTEAGIYVIADAGIRYPADVAKAIAAGANMVMIGGMFAGTEETPGEVRDGKKTFRGQASKSYMIDNGVEVINGHRTDEGIETLVTARGSVQHEVYDILGGLRSAMSYVGAPDIARFQRDAQFIHISPNTQAENRAHIVDRI